MTDPKPRNGVSKAVFEYVRKHPNCTRAQLRDGIVNAGYKESSVSSLITQNLRAGYFQEIEGKLTTTMTEYKPVSYKLKVKGAPRVQPMAAPVATTVSRDEVEHILNTLPIKKARELYDALHNIFGERK